MFNYIYILNVVDPVYTFFELYILNVMDMVYIYFWTIFMCIYIYVYIYIYFNLDSKTIKHILCEVTASIISLVIRI